MKVELSGKVVVVTGAASGIGAAVARLAAESGAGALVLSDRDADGCRAVGEGIAGQGPAVETVGADLSDLGSAAAIAGAARRRFGRIDGLVNAAGLTTRASMLDGTPGVWEELFAVNARAPYFLMREAIGDMVARGAAGAIVNVLSINAHCGAPDLAIYSATKGALLTLTKNAANAHLRDRIRVNGINLGWAATEAEHRMQSETLGHGPGWLEAAAARMPLGRLLEPGEAARLAVFLLSDASAPMTGVALDLEQRVTGA
ncbi:3-oxoacyl-[acyl-carrier protein] reductase [Rubellimicrobium mesophilum DSM 19309]|uniref:3-oxoacyl-[acyl-carrier protein] reductase n=1 Tax=Rubellimicrobium mesophilum DSM 19309 TaxID=442562 RepID=A0A017HMB1_9RHOB|nr:SDR family oxidoreductase [Rubellimicrobium mesophilum]EYD74919.1 3-oxoacyl-[acyl-carrier protein] reductase [Rubellimicrobium mesophilum DSM 19309]